VEEAGPAAVVAALVGLVEAVRAEAGLAAAGK